MHEYYSEYYSDIHDIHCMLVLLIHPQLYHESVLHNAFTYIYILFLVDKSTLLYDVDLDFRNRVQS